eukprot:scaffold2017_cov387-Prasinococcus_capsulatus_cf.AAC.18
MVHTARTPGAADGGASTPAARGTGTIDGWSIRRHGRHAYAVASLHARRSHAAPHACVPGRERALNLSPLPRPSLEVELDELVGDGGGGEDAQVSEEKRDGVRRRVVAQWRQRRQVAHRSACGRLLPLQPGGLHNGTCSCIDNQPGRACLRVWRSATAPTKLGGGWSGAQEGEDMRTDDRTALQGCTMGRARVQARCGGGLGAVLQARVAGLGEVALPRRVQTEGGGGGR